MKNSINIGLVEVENYIFSREKICDNNFWPLWYAFIYITKRHLKKSGQQREKKNYFNYWKINAKKFPTLDVFCIVSHYEVGHQTQPQMQ